MKETARTGNASSLHATPLLHVIILLHDQCSIRVEWKVKDRDTRNRVVIGCRRVVASDERVDCALQVAGDHCRPLVREVVGLGGVSWRQRSEAFVEPAEEREEVLRGS